MEMVDFVEYIKPRTYEHAVRRYVIQRLRTTINHLWDDTDVRVFGSFAAELYLPTSDVDLVVVSKDYVLTDQPKYSAKNRLYRVQDAIKNAGLATRGSVQTISGAKVPIVKYTDEATGLHVDISFENKSGLVANDTFKAWREKYPCLPILLTITKHFLSMRNLNEVYQGGIGSFTLCCLLISLLQQLPSVVSGVVSPSNNLGLMLLEFLELYGKRLNTRRVGIRVDPEKPGYFKKEDLFEMPRNPKPSDADLLVIQDPNNADNNISRSSFLIKTVMACFGEAYDALTRQMSLLEKMDFKQRKGRSLLAVLIGGDYREMEEQRERLRKVYVERIGDEADLRELKPGDVPPPPPPMFGAPPPPPPMATPASFPRNSNGSIGGRGGRGGAADRGRGSDRGRGAPRGRGAAQVGKGGGASKKQVVDLEEEEVFEKLRSNRGRRGGRGGGGKSDPVVLD